MHSESCVFASLEFFLARDSGFFRTVLSSKESMFVESGRENWEKNTQIATEKVKIRKAAHSEQIARSE